MDRFCKMCALSQERALREVLEELDALLAGLDDLQKLSLIYQLLTDTVTYDCDFRNNAYGVLRSRRGACDDISQALVVMAGYCCHDSGVFRIIGKCSGPGGGHAWNIVALSTPRGRGVWFLDPTFDLGEKKWNYFLVGGKKLRDEGRKWFPDRFPPVSETDSPLKRYRDPVKEKALLAWFAGLEARMKPAVPLRFWRT